MIKIHHMLTELKLWQKYLLMVVLGVGMGLAMAPFYILPFLPLGFMVLIWQMDHIATQDDAPPKWRQAFMMGWCLSFGYFVIGLYWMSFSFMVQAEKFAIFMPIAILGLPAFLAIFYGAAMALLIRFWRLNLTRIFVFAAVWASVEFTRSHVLSGLPWNLTAQSLVGVELLGGPVLAQLAAWIGPFGLSYVAILLCSLPAAMVELGKLNYKPLIYTVAGFVGILIFGILRLNFHPTELHDKVHVQVIQPNIPQRDKIDPYKWADNYHIQAEMTAGEKYFNLPADHVAYVVWPENAAQLIEETEDALIALSSRLPENMYFMTGTVTRRVVDDDMAFYNSFQLYERVGEIPEISLSPVLTYHKHHLVPFGEYMPLADLMGKIGLEQLSQNGGLSAGPGAMTYEHQGLKFAPNICYEIVFPARLYDVKQRPDWIVAVTNDSWFGDSAGPKQHLDQVKLRAIESGLPIVRSANSGISAVIDPMGRVTHKLDLYEKGAIETQLPVGLKKSVFDTVGHKFFYLLILLTLGWRIRASYKK